MTQKCSILHISDLHFRSDSGYESNSILDELVLDVISVCKEGKFKCNMIVITGDIAYSGKKDEYEKANKWITKLSNTLEIPKKNVVMIPGNHDINWEMISEYSKITISDQDTVTKILSEKTKPDFNRLFSKFNNFNEFMQDFYNECVFSNEKYYTNIKIDIDGIPITFLGLNTVWFSGENKDKDKVNDAKNLIVGKQQIDEILTGIETSGLVITLCHHPFDWLAEFDEYAIRKKIINSSDFLLHGHVHYSSSQEIVTPESQCVIISAGASYIHKYHKLYNILNIDFTNKIYELYFRRYSDDGSFWTKDNLTYKSVEGYYKGIFCKTDSFLVKEYPFNIQNEMMKGFSRKYYKRLLNPLNNITKVEMIRFRKEYFYHQDANPTIDEIIINIVQYGIESKLIRSTVELENILFNITIFSDNIVFDKKNDLLSYFNASYFSNIRSDIVLSSPEDIAKIGEREYLFRKQEELEKVVEKKKEREFQEKLNVIAEEENKRKTIFEEYKSKIDSYLEIKNSEIPQLPKIEEKKYIGEWHEEMGLSRDPFSSHIGLEGFSKDVYDDIVVKTDLFNRFDHMLRKDPKLIDRKSFLIFGCLGSGKTTLYKYLQKMFSIELDDSISFYIPLEAQKESEKIKSNFYQKLYDELTELIFEKLGYGYSIERNTLEDSTIRYLLNIVVSNKIANKFIIFIDDLHKNSKYISSVFEFISGLQVFRSYLYEKNIDITIFITGDQSWTINVEGEKTIGGSIDYKYVIDQITTTDALEMINKRLHFYSRNKEKKIEIEHKYIDSIFKLLKARRNLEITFRDVIEEIEKQWQNYNFESIKLTALDTNTIATMALDIETDHNDILKKINLLLDFADHDKSIFEKFVSVLAFLYEKNRAAEESSNFTDNIQYYGFLYKYDLIHKSKSNNKLYWKLSHNVMQMFRKFETKYGFKPGEYLTKVLNNKDEKMQFSSEESARITLILKTGRSYGIEFINNLENAYHGYKLVFKYTRSSNKDHDPHELLEKVLSSLCSFLKGLLWVGERLYIEQEDFYDAVEIIESHWLLLSDVKDFRDTAYKLTTKERDLAHSDIYLLCRDYLRAVKSLVSNMQRLMSYDTVFSLESLYLFNNDKKTLNEIRRNVYHENYDIAIRKIFNILFLKFVDLFYFSNLFLYGPEKWKRGLPEFLNEQISSNNTNENDRKEQLHTLSIEDFALELKDDISRSTSIYQYAFSRELLEVLHTTFLDDLVILYRDSIENNKINHRLIQNVILFFRTSKLIIDHIDGILYQALKNKIPLYLNYKSFPLERSIEKKILKTDKLEKLFEGMNKLLLSHKIIELDFNKYFPYLHSNEYTLFYWFSFVYQKLNEEKSIEINFGKDNSLFINIKET